MKKAAAVANEEEEGMILIKDEPDTDMSMNHIVAVPTGTATDEEDEEFVQLSRKKAAKTKFPPGCPVLVCRYKKDNSDNSDNQQALRVHKILVGSVYQVGIDWSENSSRDTIYKVKVSSTTISVDTDPLTIIPINEEELQFAMDAPVWLWNTVDNVPNPTPGRYEKAVVLASHHLPASQTTTTTTPRVRYSVQSITDNDGFRVYHGVLQQELVFRYSDNPPKPKIMTSRAEQAAALEHPQTTDTTTSTAASAVVQARREMEAFDSSQNNEDHENDMIYLLDSDDSEHTTTADANESWESAEPAASLSFETNTKTNEGSEDPAPAQQQQQEGAENPVSASGKEQQEASNMKDAKTESLEEEAASRPVETSEGSEEPNESHQRRQEAEYLVSVSGTEQQEDSNNIINANSESEDTNGTSSDESCEDEAPASPSSETNEGSVDLASGQQSAQSAHENKDLGSTKNTPRSGEPQFKTVKGKQYIYCPHHGTKKCLLTANHHGIEHKTVGCHNRTLAAATQGKDKVTSHADDNDTSHTSNEICLVCNQVRKYVRQNKRRSEPNDPGSEEEHEEDPTFIMDTASSESDDNVEPTESQEGLRPNTPQRKERETLPTIIDKPDILHETEQEQVMAQPEISDKESNNDESQASDSERAQHHNTVNNLIKCRHCHIYGVRLKHKEDDCFELENNAHLRPKRWISSLKSCKHCHMYGARLKHKEDDCLELEKNAHLRPIGWSTKLKSCKHCNEHGNRRLMHKEDNCFELEKNAHSRPKGWVSSLQSATHTTSSSPDVNAQQKDIAARWVPPPTKKVTETITDGQSNDSAFEKEPISNAVETTSSKKKTAKRVSFLVDPETDTTTESSNKENARDEPRNADTNRNDDPSNKENVATYTSLLEGRSTKMSASKSTSLSSILGKLNANSAPCERKIVRESASSRDAFRDALLGPLKNPLKAQRGPNRPLSSPSSLENLPEPKKRNRDSLLDPLEYSSRSQRDPTDDARSILVTNHTPSSFHNIKFGDRRHHLKRAKQQLWEESREKGQAATFLSHRCFGWHLIGTCKKDCKFWRDHKPLEPRAAKAFEKFLETVTSPEGPIFCRPTLSSSGGRHDSSSSSIGHYSNHKRRRVSLQAGDRY